MNSIPLETLEKLVGIAREYRFPSPHILHIHKQLAKKSWKAIKKYYNIKESFKEFMSITKVDNGFMWIFEDHIEMKLTERGK